eukprot:3739326-Amphidinium_carterae.2
MWFYSACITAWNKIDPSAELSDDTLERLYFLAVALVVGLWDCYVCLSSFSAAALSCACGCALGCQFLALLSSSAAHDGAGVFMRQSSRHMEPTWHLEQNSVVNVALGTLQCETSTAPKWLSRAAAL